MRELAQHGWPQPDFPLPVPECRQQPQHVQTTSVSLPLPLLPLLMPPSVSITLTSFLLALPALNYLPRLLIQNPTPPIHPLPLPQPIPHIHHPLPIENMTPRLNPPPPLLRLNPLHQRRKQQHHPPPLIHHRRPPIPTLHLTRQRMPRRLPRRIIPPQIVMPLRKVDVRLVEDGRPLERRAVQALAGGCSGSILRRAGGSGRACSGPRRSGICRAI